jgi:osmotically-inducible protein OsmY
MRAAKAAKTSAKGAKKGAKGAKKGAKGWFAFKVAKRAAPSRKQSRSKKPLIGVAGIGAALAAVLGIVKRRRVADTAKGAAHGAKSAVTPDREYDDVTLARKVESEIFRPADAPKDKVSVSVADGVVELRGELDDPKQVEQLGKTAKGVEGVKDVRNLLHTA